MPVGGDVNRIRDRAARIVCEDLLCYAHISLILKGIPLKVKNVIHGAVTCVRLAAAAGAFLILTSLAASAEECIDCHEYFEFSSGGKSTHAPFREDDCTACHLDHGDEERLVLAAEGNDLCADCHDFGDQEFLSAHKSLTGEKARCIACHDPHRSTLVKLLRPGRHRPLYFGRCDSCHTYGKAYVQPTVKDLCLSCHDREEYSRPYGHKPVVEGKCLTCHDPHGSSLPSLLLKPYSEDRWSSEPGEGYEICLQCHKADTFKARGEAETTGFRSGDVNIHRIHIEGRRNTGRTAPDRGLTCRNCHEVHSSRYAKLIRGSLDCGGVPCLRLEFKTLDEGGKCSVSCHGTKVYYWNGPPKTETADPQPSRPVIQAPPRPEVDAPTPLEKSINRRCRGCHEKDVLAFSRSNVHQPVRQGNCSACHLDHGSKPRLLLLDKEDRLCGKCHDVRSNVMGSAHHDYNLSRARCTECHDPHSSGKERLFYDFEHEPYAQRDCRACHEDARKGWPIGERINEVCGNCHGEIDDGPVLHSALPRRSCTGCHRPHGGPVEKMLRATAPDLCFRCHDASVFTGETIHPPVEEGDCGACHPSHGSKFTGLFVEAYPMERYINFSPEAYSLCWECHDGTAMADFAGTGTNFRDGGRNLHALHIHDHVTVTGIGDRVSPGLTCRNCHNPHATKGPNLIRNSLDCGGVHCLELEYRQIGEGGRCDKGCHSSQSYLPE